MTRRHAFLVPALLALATATAALAARSAEQATVDCTAANVACEEIAVAGDSPAAMPSGAPSPARGFADPSLRKDPARNRIWMVYSWPHTTTAVGRAATAVDTHLAYSDDGGTSWRFDRALWQSAPSADSIGNGPAIANSEAVSIEPRTTAAGTVWYSVRDRYVIGTGGKFRLSTYRLRIATASSPEELATAPEQVLGGGISAAPGAVDVDLSALSPALAGCVFRDSGLHFERGRLYLAAECSRYTTQGEDYAREFVALFSTDAAGPVGGWKWRYAGKFGDRRDAAALGGANLQQTDLVAGRSGQLLAIVSPSRDAQGSGLSSHLGCRVLQLASLDPPRLARTAAGRLRVLDSVTASDLMPNGPAACGYAAASATGIVLVRRDLSGGAPVVSLHRTGLRP